MARKVVWTFTAKKQRTEILEYWIERTGNKRYSRKLSIQFRKKAKLFLNFMHLGKPTEFEEVRVTSLGHCNCLWDSRRNPKDLLKILK